jgi:branched-chain amino acid transport system substrate-binding protein
VLAKAIEQANSIDRDKVRAALTAIHYESVVGEVTFDDHNQARLPMILLEIEKGKPVIKGTFTGEIDYPK